MTFLIVNRQFIWRQSFFTLRIYPSPSDILGPLQPKNKNEEKVQIYLMLLLQSKATLIYLFYQLYKTDNTNNAEFRSHKSLCLLLTGAASFRQCSNSASTKTNK